MRNVTPRPLAAAARGSRDEDGAPSPTSAMSSSSSNDDLLVVPGAEAGMVFNSDVVDRVVD